MNDSPKIVRVVVKPRPIGLGPGKFRELLGLSAHPPSPASAQSLMRQTSATALAVSVRDTTPSQERTEPDFGARSAPSAPEDARGNPSRLLPAEPAASNESIAPPAVQGNCRKRTPPPIPEPHPHAALPNITAAPLLDERAVSARLGLSVRTLRNWRVKGIGPKFVRLSRRAVRYAPADVDAWIAARTVGSTSEGER